MLVGQSEAVGGLKGIADAAHTSYEGATLVAQFLAQVTNMYVYYVGVAEVIVAPNTVEDDVAGKYLPGVTEEKLHHIELALCKLNDGATPGNTARPAVERYIACAQHLLHVDAFAPEDRAQAGDEFLEGEGVNQIIVSAAFQAEYSVLYSTPAVSM